MKIKIKKQDKVKEFKLINKWEDVTLEKWLALIDYHKLSKTEETLETIKALSNIPKKLIKELELKDVAIIMNRIAELQQKQDSSLKRVIEIDGKRYGFHPDLDSITLGEWSDLETIIKMDVEKHLPEVMAILYRPIVEEQNDIYTIKAYDGDISIRAEQMKKMAAEQVQSALVFFYTLGKESLVILQSFLTDQLKETKTQ